MTLAPGGKLGPYEIVAPLGAGGMGEVYKARDTRLERTVAIKVLPASLAHDPEFRARFDREAKSISALNHPHICTLHDVGEADGSAYLVMEHLEGETLADRLAKGPLPIADTLVIASQIAEALDKAHRQGIVHRDLKPANVFLVRSIGAPHCKLLDFGLAKTGVQVSSGSFETRLATSPPGGTGTPLTAQGTILGTFQYMAPEQIEWTEADARADIWAFGCVLYEMLTARRAFEGKSQASLIASILDRQPAPVSELQPLTPPALGRIVRTCLEKHPDNRFHTAHDLWLQLQWIDEGGSAAGLAAPVIAERKRRRRLVNAALLAGVAALAVAATWWLKPEPVVQQVVGRFTVTLPQGQAFTRTGRRFVAISPDGTKIAYMADHQIYLRNLHEQEAVAIRGTDVDPLDLVFSPDGTALAFLVPTQRRGALEDATIKAIDVRGGAARTVAAAGPTFGISWTAGRILFSLGDRIVSVPDAGGEPETLVKATPGSGERLGHPQLLHDGRTLLYSVMKVGGATPEGRVVAQALPHGEQRILVDGTDGRITPTGHLLWVRGHVLFAQTIDRDSLQLSGPAVPLIEAVRNANSTATGQVAVSDTGILVHAIAGDSGEADLMWVDRKGTRTPTGAPADRFQHPRLSPDGKKVALDTSGSADSDIWIWDLERKISTKLTSGPAIDGLPVWTPDGRSVVFMSAPAANRQGDLYRRAADGTGTTERLTETTIWHFPQMVLPDGRILARLINPTNRLFLIPPTPGTTAAAVFRSPESTALIGRISPDGKWIAYSSVDDSTRTQIHVRPFPNTDAGYWRISTDSGHRPLWSRSGDELFYHASFPDRLMRVQVLPPGPNGAFAFGTPSALFPLSGYATGSPFGADWDISPDGQRFLMVVPIATGDTDRQSLIIVMNWFDELRSRMKTN